MANILLCEACGTGFEHDPDAFAAVCPDCGHRHQPRSGAC